MKSKRILGVVLSAVMVISVNSQILAAETTSTLANITNTEATITIQTDAPTLLTSEQLLELIEQAPDITETRSRITLADRRITEAELTAWKAEYWELGGINSYELEVIRLINIERVNAGLNQLAVEPILIMTARFHSQEMADLQYFNHRSPHHGRGRDRAEMFGHENIQEHVWGIRENISGSTRSPEMVVQSWMKSPGHRAAILGEHYLTIGVGAVQGGGTTANFGS